MARKNEAPECSIESYRKDLENSAWLAAFRRELKKYDTNFIEIRFLAVGNFGLEDKNAEYQTALTLILRDQFNIQKVTCWDPNFKKRDLKILADLEISVKATDPPFNPGVLWWVPHAPYFLEPALLERVKGCVYIGNDLTISDSQTLRDERLCAWYRDQAKITPIKVKPKDPWKEAFKNTAIHQLIN